MSRRLTDEELARINGTRWQCVMDAVTPGQVVAMVIELRQLRAQALTKEEREALEWTVSFIRTMRGSDDRQPFNVHAAKALSALSRLLGKEEG